jgi:ATP-binding cassette subfamily A (ABC1) protein 3
LQKVYNENFTAVKDLNLTLYPDQISVLLGHNGAGKSTTIGMLTGLIDQTKGTAKIFGINIFDSMEKVR